jgi:hypothetical protein
MTRSSPRNSLKKHDAAASSRASKARRDRTTTQIRKDKRRETVQSKRRRLLSSDDVALSGRDITELVAILSGTNGDATSHADQYEVLQEIRALLAANEHDYEAVERVIESGVSVPPSHSDARWSRLLTLCCLVVSIRSCPCWCRCWTRRRR